MREWPSSLRSYSFNSHEVEKITGVGRATQRQWLVRYLDFRQQQFIFRETEDQRAAQAGEWSWEGVQLVALFSLALRDLHDGASARKVLMLDPQTGVVRDELGIFHSDQRREQVGDEDLLIAGYLGGWDDFGFATTGASGLAGMVACTEQAARLYVINFSAFQRNLYKRLTQVIDVETGLGALPEALRA